MTAHASAPSAPTRARRLPAEWWFAIIFGLIGVGIRICVPIRWIAADEVLYLNLAKSFLAGFVIMISLGYGHALLDAVDPARRPHWRWSAGQLAIALTLTLYIFVRAPRILIVNRLLEASALGLALTAGALTLVLPLFRVVRWRDAAAAFLQSFGLWGVFLVYNALATFCLMATMQSTPLVWDPVLLRMDLSLGINPAQIASAWRFALPGILPLSNTAYALLALMIAGVIARLQTAGELAHARRALFASFLVAVLGLACYQVVPAIGPVYAYPKAYPTVDSPTREADAAAALAPALTGPRQIRGSTSIVRNVMPSLHAAFTFVALAAAWSWRRRFFWQCFPLGTLQVATTLTLAVHYFVDLLAAVPLAVLCWWIADRTVRASPQAAECPLPALAVSGPERAARARQLGLALAVSVGGLLGWAWLAPIPPWIAWPLAVLVVAAPVTASLRHNRHALPPINEDAAAAHPVPRPWPVRLLAVAVFCTGGTALVLEQIYEKYLSTLVGSSRSAATIVLAVYFTGLALGAWLCPKKSAGAPRRLALLELFIAAWAVLVGLAFFACDRALGAALAAAGSGAFTLASARAIVAALWILPPTLAMGAQLPTLAAVLAGDPLWRGETISRYYTLNLAGAFVFTLATPPLLFCTVGADGALWTIALLGLAVGLALWFGLPRDSLAPPPLDPGPSQVTPSPVAPLLIAFAAGFLFFALEVVWFHLISAVCGASTFSFSLLLAIILLGLALGGRAAQKLPSPSPGALGPTLAWLLAALVLSSALWPAAGTFMAREQAGEQLAWFWAGEMLKGIVVAFIVLPSAALAGRIFPQLLRGAEHQKKNGRTVGALCAWNVAGCVAGALLTGYVLIPWLGAEHALLGLTGAVAAGWLWLLLRQPREMNILLPGIAGLFLLAMLPRWNRLELTAGYGLYLRRELPADARLEFFREDFTTGFVTVVSSSLRDRAAPVRVLLQNGKFDADNSDEMPAQLGFGLVAALHAPAHDRAFVIGCGSGQTLGLISRLGFARVDLAELSPAHLAAARAEFADINAHVLDRPNVAVHVEDGRNFLLRSRTAYDLIQIEISSVWFAGATNLYSREFYALARTRLAPGGVLVQWVQLHHLTPRELAVIFATAQSEFSSVSIWQVGKQACLLASDRAPTLNPAIWRQWRDDPALFDERLITNIVTPAAFAATEVVPAAKLRALLARTPAVINTDANRWLEFQTPQYYLDRRDLRAENLRWLTAPVNVTPRAP